MKQLDEGDVVSVMEFFRELDDPRCDINRKHVLCDIIVICICAVVSGADGPLAIGTWAQSKGEWLKRYLELPHGIPSHDTIGRVLATLRPGAFQACFGKWVEHLQSGNEDASEASRPAIAIDGKALCQSFDKRRNLGPLFVVSAWSVSNGISLGQLAIPEKTSEITAIPELIDHINVQGAIVTIDAAGCQKNIAQSIVDHGGDYVLALKGNQGKIHNAVQAYIQEQLACGFTSEIGRRHHVSDKGHGREEEYHYHQFAVPTTLLDREKWAGLTTIGAALRVSTQGGKTSVETRYFLSSLKLGVKQFANSVRGHWAIENTLHWCLDITFREDESRLRDRIASENLAWLRRFGLGLLKQHPSKDSVAMKRRKAGWNDEYLMQVLGISIR